MWNIFPPSYAFKPEFKNPKEKEKYKTQGSDRPIAEKTPWPAYKAEFLGSAICCLLEMPSRTTTSYFFSKKLKNKI